MGNTTTARVQDFDAEYRSALEEYVARADELALSRAYEIGRQALVNGLGVLDMVTLHEATVDAIVAMLPSAKRLDVARTALEFFRESVSPFDMTIRGYREANEELGRLNKKLKDQNHTLVLMNDELEAFSYSVSHDLRAPLRSIDGFSKALLEDYEVRLDEAGGKYLHHIRDSARYMAQLIDGLLLLARVARTHLQPRDVDLSAIAHVIAERLRASEPQRSVEFAIAEGAHATGDTVLLTVVLENLLGNAWKYTSKRERARIEFKRSEREGFAVYCVSDNGAGFDMTYAGRLFKPFQRLHSAREFEGTGIGLATVQRIIQRHEGRLWAEGRVDGGATFCFTLYTKQR